MSIADLQTSECSLSTGHIVDVEDFERSLSPRIAQTSTTAQRSSTQTVAAISKALIDYHSKVNQLIQSLPVKLLLNHAQIELFQELVKDIEESGKVALESF